MLCKIITKISIRKIFIILFSIIARENDIYNLLEHF